MNYKQKYLKYKMKYLQTKKLFKQEHYLRGGAAAATITNSNEYISEEEFAKLSKIEKFCYNNKNLYYKKNVKIEIDSDAEEYYPIDFILLDDYNLIIPKSHQFFYDNTVLYYRKKEQKEIDNIITELKKNNEISQEQYNELDNSIQALYYKKDNKSSEEIKYILNRPFLLTICQAN